MRHCIWPLTGTFGQWRRGQYSLSLCHCYILGLHCECYGVAMQLHGESVSSAVSWGNERGWRGFMLTSEMCLCPHAGVGLIMG